MGAEPSTSDWKTVGMRVLGLISGTSYDGIDTAVVDFGLDGDILQGEIGYRDTTPYDAELRALLAASLPPTAVPLETVCRLDTLIGQAFARAAVAAGPVDLVCSHGQTVYHWVADGRALGTLQLGQPAWIAEATGAPVVADVRARDIAVGGQGAPLVPLLDTLLLGDRSAALNIGGIANITIAGDPPIAFDIGPGNALIDVVAQRLGRRYDEDGRLAASGRIDESLLARLLDEPYYAAPPPKSTGKEHFNSAYLDAHTRASTVDTAATVTALTAETIARDVRRHEIDTVVVSGGGYRNPTLMSMLRDRLADKEIRGSSDLGVDEDAKEAVAFALIGWYVAHGLPASVPSCTGGQVARILGSITPGAGPLRLPPPLPTAPSRLSVSSAPRRTAS